jgi:hypothetical protein
MKFVHTERFLLFLQTERKGWQLPAPNKRFGASGAVTRLKVCANLQVCRPSERQWKPRLRQAAGTLCATADSAVDNETEK